MTQWSKKKRTNNKIKQKQQALITSKIYVGFFKFISKVKIASDKTENKNNLYFNRKEMGPLHNKAW